MTNVSIMSDELNILKAQMQVLSSQLSKDDIISEKMFRTTLQAHVSNLTPSRRMCIIGIVTCGIFMPAVFITGHIMNGFMTLPFLIGTLILCLYGTLRSYRALRFDIEHTIQSESLSVVATQVAEWRRANAIDALMTTILGIAWCVWFIIEDWAELSNSLEQCIFVALIFVFVFSTNLSNFIRVSHTTRDLLNQIDEMKK